MEIRRLFRLCVLNEGVVSRKSVLFLGRLMSAGKNGAFYQWISVLRDFFALTRGNTDWEMSGARCSLKSCHLDMPSIVLR